MNETEINSSEWTPVLTSSATDIIIQPNGPVKLCFGDSSSVPLSLGISIGPGDMLIIPSGVDVSAVSVGAASSSIISGPFGA